MKTQITKENALIIIEGAVKHQSLVNKLERTLDTDLAQWNGTLTMLEPLFNMDLHKMDEITYDKYYSAYFDIVNEGGNDFAKKAEKIYNGILALSLKYEKQQEKEKSKTPGVISLLKDHNYKIQGNFNLET